MMFHQASHRILIIEHDTWIRSDLRAHLVKAGYRVQDASNGFTGLRLAQAVTPDLIVLGSALPDLASALVREELEDDPSTRSVPVIALGADGPNSLSLLTDEVHKTLEARSA